MKKENKIKKILVMTLAFAIVFTTIVIIGQAGLNKLTDEKTTVISDCINPLKIIAPHSVMEGKGFFVSVLANGIPIKDVLVKFLDRSYYTNANGTVLTAPSVKQTRNYTITASKPGYIKDIARITVLDGAKRQLVIDAPHSVQEGERFLIKVTANNIPMKNVFVELLNNSYYTSSNGNVILTAPLVEHDSVLTIYANKENYISDMARITILDSKK